MTSGDGLGFADFSGTEDSPVLEIEVNACRRLIGRRRYRMTWEYTIGSDMLECNQKI